MNYDELVSFVKASDHSESLSRFAVGDALLEHCPIGPDGAHNGGFAILARIARDTGIEYDALEARRSVADRVPPTTRVVGVSWSAYREIAWVTDASERARLLTKVRTEDPQTDSGRWTVTAVRALINKAATYIHSSQVGPERERYPVKQVLAADAETKVEAFAKLAADPDVIEAAAQTVTPAQQAFEQLGAKVAEYHEAQQAVADAADPTGRQLGETAALYRLQTTVQRACREVEAIIPLVGTVPESTRALDMADLGIGADIRRWQEVGGRLEHLATYGESDLDTFVASTLKGG